MQMTSHTSILSLQAAGAEWGQAEGTKPKGLHLIWLNLTLPLSLAVQVRGNKNDVAITGLNFLQFVVK